MESIALFRGGSLSKLPLHEPCSTISMLASSLRFDFKKLSFPQLSNVSTSVSIGPSGSFNVRDKFLAHCGNAHSGETHSNAKEDSLKSLLSLVQPKEKNSPTSAIISTKNEALRLVVEEKYDEAMCHMKHLCEGDADVAYEARVAHVQILIRLDEYNKALLKKKKEYNKALEFLEKKGNFPQSKAFDTRLSLYKAVVHTMLSNDGKAEEWWNTYLKTLGNGNGNVNDKLKTHCRNTNSEFMTSAKDILKPLLSLKPPPTVEKGSLFFKILPTKIMALKAVVDGKYDAAEHHMKKLCNDVGNSEEALEAQLAYIQILIYLDKYEEALERLIEKENHFPPFGSDARPCLYKAIGLTALGMHEDAKICWKAFMKTIGLPNRNED